MKLTQEWFPTLIASTFIDCTYTVLLPFSPALYYLGLGERALHGRCGEGFSQWVLLGQYQGIYVLMSIVAG